MLVMMPPVVMVGQKENLSDINYYPICSLCKYENKKQIESPKQQNSKTEITYQPCYQHIFSL